MPTWQEWFHRFLKKFLFKNLKLTFDIGLIFVLTRNETISITILCYHKHVEIFKVLHFLLNLENFVERWHKLYDKYFAPNLLYESL